MRGIYCKSIDRALKMQFNEGSDNFPPPIIPELWKDFLKQIVLFWAKNKCINIRRF